MRTMWVDRADFEAMIEREEITDAQTVAAYMLLLLFERRTKA
jgi:hypothetical protein